ncbi:adrenomedullin a [Paramisgurnus dabryanus]|uniref:adrenomedullin a n=1 Tax=Paramisgurnus dabryanus TaxID=90735 RepID=UPI0031F3BA68
MQLILQTVFCCCLLATVALCVHGAKYDLRQVLKRSVWPQRSKRDLIPAALRTLENSQFVRPDDIKDSLMPHSRTDISVRTKRSNNQFRRVGCSLATCTVHVLAHRLHDASMNKIGHAPLDKISPLGYGRRRRSVPEKVISLRQEGRRLRPVWSSPDSRSQLRKLEALLKRT